MNYLSALHVDREPFSLSPDPAFFYPSKDHKTAIDRLEIVLRLKRGLNIVLGDVGTGKTTLLRALLQKFHAENDYVFHLILDPSYKNEHQFLTHLTQLFGIAPFFRSVVDHRAAIEKYLYQKCIEEGKSVVLIIDEGQKLTDGQLEILRTFLNYETNEQKMLQLVILGQMELLPRIKRIHNFFDRISFKYIIKPMEEFETRRMIEFRLQKAGYRAPGPLFTHEAVHKIYQYAQGYPRRTALVCRNCLEYLIMNSVDRVTADIVDKILQEEYLWV